MARRFPADPVLLSGRMARCREFHNRCSEGKPMLPCVSSAKFAESAVNDRVGLLQLPDVWQQHVASGRISAAAAERLVPWRDYPSVLDSMELQVKNCPMPVTDFGSISPNGKARTAQNR